MSVLSELAPENIPLTASNKRETFSGYHLKILGLFIEQYDVIYECILKIFALIFFFRVALTFHLLYLFVA